MGERERRGHEVEEAERMEKERVVVEWATLFTRMKMEKKVEKVKKYLGCVMTGQAHWLSQEGGSMTTDTSADKTRFI